MGIIEEIIVKDKIDDKFSVKFFNEKFDIIDVLKKEIKFKQIDYIFKKRVLEDRLFINNFENIVEEVVIKDNFVLSLNEGINEKIIITDFLEINIIEII